jgi:hypothetical protein
MANQQLRAQLDSIRSRTSELTSGLTPDQLTRRPSPSSWSITECLAHLNLTAAVVQPKVAAAIERARKNHLTGSGPFFPGALGRLLFWIAEPPPKFRMRAPKKILPAVAHAEPAQVASDFMKVQDLWEKLINDAEGLDQNRIKVASFPGLPRMRLSGIIPWMLAHQRRHLLQAENVKQEICGRSSRAGA